MKCQPLGSFSTNVIKYFFSSKCIFNDDKTEILSLFVSHVNDKEYNTLLINNKRNLVANLDLI